MKILKRSGAEAVFDINKIIAAVTKANQTVDLKNTLTAEQIQAIGKYVEGVCAALDRALSVEEIQDIVETQIMKAGAFEVAKKYITYRYVRSLVRQANSTDKQILTLIECNNEDIKQENSNKNPTVNSVQRDYMAGEVSKDIASRMKLVEGDSVSCMEKLMDPVDVIYLDPMFPKRQKSGLINKKLQLIQKLEPPCSEEKDLFDAAIKAGPSRIIVKRPLKSVCLDGREPSYILKGKAIRYDCYVM